MKPAKVCRIATVCAILHNMAILLGERDIEETEDNVQQPYPNIEYQGEDVQDGQTRREHIVTNYFS